MLGLQARYFSEFRNNGSKICCIRAETFFLQVPSFLCHNFTPRHGCLCRDARLLACSIHRRNSRLLQLGTVVSICFGLLISSRHRRNSRFSDNFLFASEISNVFFPQNFHVKIVISCWDGRPDIFPSLETMRTQYVAI